ncbi:hypothetical protein J6590_048571 [Homalodisca vitripennis]|nr:hypothetical protein J6590_048571 [Homalodisca vitripennis]
MADICEVPFEVVKSPEASTPRPPGRQPRCRLYRSVFKTYTKWQEQRVVVDPAASSLTMQFAEPPRPAPWPSGPTKTA